MVAGYYFQIDHKAKYSQLSCDCMNNANYRYPSISGMKKLLSIQHVMDL